MVLEMNFLFLIWINTKFIRFVPEHSTHFISFSMTNIFELEELFQWVTAA